MSKWVPVWHLGWQIVAHGVPLTHRSFVGYCNTFVNNVLSDTEFRLKARKLLHTYTDTHNQ